MPVKVVFDGREHEIDPPVAVRDVLRRLDIPPGTVLPIRNGDLVTEDERLEDGDTLELMNVISGGQ